jgi:hypothetical protein
MDNPGFGANNFVHEVSHNSEMRHTATMDTCGTLVDNSPDTNTDWPYSDPTIQEFGYNPDTGKIHNPSGTYDIMSYCAPPWISPFHWEQQFDHEGARVRETAIQSTDGPVIGIVATLDNPDVDGDTGGSFDTLYRSETGNIAAPTPGSGYSVQLRAGNSVLAEQPFDVSFVNIEDGSEPLADAFVTFSMGAPAGATSVVLLRGTEILDTQQISGGSPTVNFTDPSSHQNWTAGTTETIAWTGSDPDSDSLVYTVFYSKDGGTSFEVLQSDLSATSLTVEVDSLAGAEEAIFRVMASDGVNTGTGDSASVTVPNKPPFVGITSPADGALAEEGGLVVLQGGAVDLEDGSLEGADLEWSSDRDGELGMGGYLPLNTLSGGEHEITLTAADSDGAQSTDTITLFVGVRGAVRFVRSVVDPADPQNVTAVVTLVPGMPTEDINEASLQLRVGGVLVDPIGTEHLGDTNADGLPELAVTFAGQTLVNAIPNPGVETNVVVVGEMDDNAPFQAKGLLAEIAAGDADCSGTLTPFDAARVLMHVAQIRTVDCLIAVDMDCDTSVTPTDALGIMEMLAGVDSGLTEGCAPPAAAAVSEPAASTSGSHTTPRHLPGHFAALTGVPAVALSVGGGRKIRAT